MEEEIEIMREYFNEGNSYDVILDMCSANPDIKNVAWNPEHTAEKKREQVTCRSFRSSALLKHRNRSVSHLRDFHVADHDCNTCPEPVYSLEFPCTHSSTKTP